MAILDSSRLLTDTNYIYNISVIKHLFHCHYDAVIDPLWLDITGYSHHHP